MGLVRGFAESQISGLCDKALDSGPKSVEGRFGVVILRTTLPAFFKAGGDRIISEIGWIPDKAGPFSHRSESHAFDVGRHPGAIPFQELTRLDVDL
jgi:hypothetical protein